LEQSGGPFLFGNDFSAADVIFGLNILVSSLIILCITCSFI